MVKKRLEPQTMEELLAQEGMKFSGLKRGQIVEGVVTNISGKQVFIDVGGKTEGVVYSREIPYIKDLLCELKIGDKVICYIVSPEDEAGHPVVSLRKFQWQRKWGRLEEALKKEEVIEVKGEDVNKGGLLVSYKDLNGFIPSSQLNPTFTAKPQELINKVIQVKVVEIDPKNNRLIFSQRQATGGKKIEEIEKVLAKFPSDQKFSGKVSGILPFGVFVALEEPPELKGLDGLVHISEIAWEKVDDPKKFYKVGDKVEVAILGIEKKSGKLNLSIKKLLPDPWKDLAKMYQKDQEVEGKVTKVSDFGVFVELEKGIEGLLHVSKIPQGKKFSEGEKITCLIELVDPVKHRISLTLLPTEKPIGYK